MGSYYLSAQHARVLQRELVIFDLDGTLLDSTGSERECYMRTFDSLGLDYDEENLDRYVNEGTEKAFSDVDDGFILYSDFLRQFVREASRPAEIGAVPFHDTKVTLEAIAGAGIPMCIATRMGGARAHELLEMNGLDSFFDQIVGAEDVERHKPDPECIYRCLDFHGVGQDCTAFVGDSPKDMYASEGAGVEGILIDRDSRYESFGDHRIIRDLRELLW